RLPYATPTSVMPPTSPAAPGPEPLTDHAHSARPAAHTTSSGATNGRGPYRSASPPASQRDSAAAAVSPNRPAAAATAPCPSWGANVRRAPPGVVTASSTTDG